MTTVKQILSEKGRDVWSIGPDDSVLDAIKMMADRGVGALLVTEGGLLAGIVSERDYARKVILKGKSSQHTRVAEIMTSPVICGRMTQSVQECMALMTEKRVRHLPIMDSDRLVGIISIGDVVKAIIDEQRFTIEQLEHYIAGDIY